MNPESQSCRGASEAALPRVTCKLYNTNFIPLPETTPAATTISACLVAIVSPPDAHAASTRVDGVCGLRCQRNSRFSDDTCSCATSCISCHSVP